MSKRWFEIALPVPSALVDEAAALLDFAGFGGVEIRDRGQVAQVVVVVEAADDPGEQVATARDAIAVLGDAGEPVVMELDPRTWTENWKKHFARRVFAERLEVRPPWEERSSDAELSLVINPGMAFGTGLHETTAGCLELLVHEAKPGMRVADVGCGSGILAIAAALLGAREVLATDVDPLAVEATLENIEANGVGAVVRVELEPGEVGIPEWERDARPGLAAAHQHSLGSRAAAGQAGRAGDAANATPAGRVSDAAAAADPAGDADATAAGQQSSRPSGPVEHESVRPNGATSGGFAAQPAGSFDLVVANILAETLVELRDVLSQAVAPGGTLLLSGIEARRLKLVEEAFIGPRWRLARSLPKGDWVSIALHPQA